MLKLIKENYGVLTGNWPLDTEKPTLIFIHGAALSKGLWEFQVDQLSDIANTIAIDLPGHKDSKGPASDQIAEYAQSVADFIDLIQAPDPILCGMSMGGAVALDLLIRHPKRFRSGILMHTGARLRVLPFVFETVETDLAKYIDLFSDFATSKNSDKGKIKVLMKEIAVTESSVALKDFAACDQFDVMNRLSEIISSVMVVVGDEDNLTPPKYGEFLYKNISGARLETISEAGHLSPIERPDEVNQLIRDFVTQSGKKIEP